MTGPSTVPLVIDTDNALGVPENFWEHVWGGDVDDAFAIAFALRAFASVESIYSVAGNASMQRCHRNNQQLCEILNSSVPCHLGFSARGEGAEPPVPKNGIDYLALGPLTNLAQFLSSGFLPKRIWMTLGRRQTWGRWPPIFPMEFNATKDIEALKSVFSSPISKIIVPLDVAIDFKFLPSSENRRKLMSTEIGVHLWKHSRRWRWRSLLFKGRRKFPVWDLVSVMACLYPELVRMEHGQAHVFKNGLVICDVNGKPTTGHRRELALHSVPVSIVTGFDTKKMWDLFFKVLQADRPQEVPS